MGTAGGPATDTQRSGKQKRLSWSPAIRPGSVATARVIDLDRARRAHLVGVVFLMVGILGFIPGVTTHRTTHGLRGHKSVAQLVGVFRVSVLNNIVHILFGLAGLNADRTARAARYYLVVGGLLCRALALYGVIDLAKNSCVPVDHADNCSPGSRPWR